MKDSIEERFVDVQDAKMALAKGSMERLKEEDRKKANVRISSPLAFQYSIISVLNSSYIPVQFFVLFPHRSPPSRIFSR